MRLLASAVLLGLSWFAAVNLVLSAAAWIASRWALHRSGSTSATLLLAVRLLPAAAASLFLALVFLPAHLRYEPADPDERFGAVLLALAMLGLGSILGSARRLMRVVADARQVRRWRLAPLDAGTEPAYEVAGFPGMSLAGIVRTRILIGSSARAALTPSELELALAHERAHRRSFDNLKRCLVFCAPDFFGGSRAASRLEAAWRARLEREADLRAVDGDEHRAIHLASALVKVARLGGPVSAVSSPLWSTFNEPPLLESRVRDLVSGRAERVPPRGRRVAAAAALGAGAAVCVWLVSASHGVHRLTETLVGLLP